MFELGFGRVGAAVCSVLTALVVLVTACSVVGVDAASAGAPAGNAGVGVGRVGLLAGAAVSMDRVFAPSFARVADTLRLSEVVGDGFDVQDVRFARSVGDESFYVAPSANGKSVCLVAVKGDESALSCGKASRFDVDRDVALASERADGTTRIVGVVPDGVSRVVGADGVVDVVAANVFVLASVESGEYTLYGPGLAKPITQVFEGVGNTPESGSVVSEKQVQPESEDAEPPVSATKQAQENRTEREKGEVGRVVTRSSDVDYYLPTEFHLRLRPSEAKTDGKKGTKSLNSMSSVASEELKIWYQRAAPRNQRVAVHEGHGYVATTHGQEHERFASAHCQNPSVDNVITVDFCTYRA